MVYVLYEPLFAELIQKTATNFLSISCIHYLQMKF